MENKEEYKQDKSWQEIEDDKITNKLDQSDSVSPLQSSNLDKNTPLPIDPGKSKKTFNPRFIATSILPIFLAIILVFGTAVASVPSWRNSAVKFFRQYALQADAVCLSGQYACYTYNQEQGTSSLNCQEQEPSPMPTNVRCVYITPTESPVPGVSVKPTPANTHLPDYNYYQVNFVDQILEIAQPKETEYGNFLPAGPYLANINDYRDNSRDPEFFTNLYKSFWWDSGTMEKTESGRVNLLALSNYNNNFGAKSTVFTMPANVSTSDATYPSYIDNILNSGLYNQLLDKNRDFFKQTGDSKTVNIYPINVNDANPSITLEKHTIERNSDGTVKTEYDEKSNPVSLSTNLKSRPEIVVAPIQDFRNPQGVFNFETPTISPNFYWLTPIALAPKNNNKENLLIGTSANLLSNASGHSLYLGNFNGGGITLDSLFSSYYPNNSTYKEAIIDKGLYPIENSLDFDYTPIYLQARKISDNRAILDEIKTSNINKLVNGEDIAGIDYDAYAKQKIKFKINGKGELAYLKLNKETLKNNKYEYIYEPIAKNEKNEGEITLNDRGFGNHDDHMLIYKPAKDQEPERAKIDFILPLKKEDQPASDMKELTSTLLVDVSKIKSEIKEETLSEDDSLNDLITKTFTGSFKVSQPLSYGEQPINSSATQAGSSTRSETISICPYEETDDSGNPVCLEVAKKQDGVDQKDKIVINDISAESPQARDGAYYFAQLDNNGEFKFTLEYDESKFTPNIRVFDSLNSGYVEMEVKYKPALYTQPYYVSYEDYGQYLANVKNNQSTTISNLDLRNLRSLFVSSALAQDQSFELVKLGGEQEKVTDETVQTPLYKYTMKKFAITIPEDFNKDTQSAVSYVLLPPGMSVGDIKITPNNKNIKINSYDLGGYTKVEINLSDAKAKDTYNLEIPFEFKITAKNAKIINQQVKDQIDSIINTNLDQFKTIYKTYYDDYIKLNQSKIDLLESVNKVNLDSDNISIDGENITAHDFSGDISTTKSELDEFKKNYNKKLTQLEKNKNTVLKYINEKSTDNDKLLTSMQDENGYIEYDNLQNFAAQISAQFSMSNLEKIFPFGQTNKYVSAQQNDLDAFINSNTYEMIMNNYDDNTDVKGKQVKMQDTILTMQKHNDENETKVNSQYQEVQDKLNPYKMIDRILESTNYILNRNNLIDTKQIQESIVKVFDNEEIASPSVKNIAEHESEIALATSITDVQTKIDAIDGEIINTPLYGAFVENKKIVNNSGLIENAQASDKNISVVYFKPLIYGMNVITVDNPQVYPMIVTHENKIYPYTGYPVTELPDYLTEKFRSLIADNTLKTTDKIYLGDKITYQTIAQYKSVRSNAFSDEVNYKPLKNFSAKMKVIFNQEILYENDNTKLVEFDINGENTNSILDYFTVQAKDQSTDSFIIASPYLIYEKWDKQNTPDVYRGEDEESQYCQHVSGKIIGPDGKGLPNTKFNYSNTNFSSPEEESVYKEPKYEYSRTDRDGNYELELFAYLNYQPLTIESSFKYFFADDSRDEISVTSRNEYDDRLLEWKLDQADITVLKNGSGEYYYSSPIQKDIKIAQYDDKTKSFVSDPKPVNEGQSKNLYKKTTSSFINNSKLYSYFDRLNDGDLIDGNLKLDITYNDKQDSSSAGSDYETKSGDITLDQRIWRNPQDLLSVTKNTSWVNTVLAHELMHVLDFSIWQEKYKNFRCLKNDQDCFSVPHQGLANDYSNDAYVESLAEYGAKYLEPKTSLHAYSSLYSAILYNIKYGSGALDCPQSEENAYNHLILLLYPIESKISDTTAEQSDKNFQRFINERYSDPNIAFNISDYYDKLIKNSSLGLTTIKKEYASHGICDVNKNYNWVCDKGEQIGRPINSRLTFYSPRLIYHQDGSSRSHEGEITVRPRSWRKYPTRTDIPLVVNSIGATAKITNSDIDEITYYNSYDVANYDIQTGEIADRQTVEVANNHELEIDIPKDNNKIVVISAKGAGYWTVSAKDYWQTVNSSLYKVDAINHNFIIDKVDAGGNPETNLTIEDAVGKYKSSDQYIQDEDSSKTTLQEKRQSINDAMNAECQTVVDAHNKEYEEREAKGESETSLLVWREPLFDEEAKCYEKYYSQLETVDVEIAVEEQNTVDTAIDTQVDLANNSQPIVTNNMQESRDEIQSEAIENAEKSIEQIESEVDKCQSISDEYGTKYLELLKKKNVDDASVTDEELQAILNEQYSKEQECYDANSAKKYSPDQITKATNIIYRLQTEQFKCKIDIENLDEQFVADNKDLISQVQNFDFPEEVSDLDNKEPFKSWPQVLKDRVRDHELTINSTEDRCNAEYISLAQELQNIKDGNDKAYFENYYNSFTDTVRIILDQIQYDNLLNWVYNLGKNESEKENVINYQNQQDQIQNIQEQLTQGDYIPDAGEPIDLNEIRSNENYEEDSDDDEYLPPECEALADEADAKFKEDNKDLISQVQNFNFPEEPSDLTDKEPFKSYPQELKDKITAHETSLNELESKCEEKYSTANDNILTPIINYIQENLIIPTQNLFSQNTVYNENGNENDDDGDEYSSPECESLVDEADIKFKEENADLIAQVSNFNFPEELSDLANKESFKYWPQELKDKVIIHETSVNALEDKCEEKQNSNNIFAPVIDYIEENILTPIENLFSSVTINNLIPKAYAVDTPKSSIYFTKLNGNADEVNQINSAIPGQTIILNVKEFTNSRNIQVFIDNTYLEDAKILGGSFGLKLKLPLNLKNGTHTIKVIGDAQGEYSTKEITINCPKSFSFAWIYWIIGMGIISLSVYLIIIKRKQAVNSQEYIDEEKKY